MLQATIRPYSHRKNLKSSTASPYPQKAIKCPCKVTKNSKVILLDSTKLYIVSYSLSKIVRGYNYILNNFLKFGGPLEVTIHSFVKDDNSSKREKSSWLEFRWSYYSQWLTEKWLTKYESEIKDTVALKSFIFWDTMPCSPLRVNRYFGGQCLLRLQGRRISQARNQYGAGSIQGLQICSDFYLLHSSFCLIYYSALKTEAKCSSEASIEF
jgi:hypothetical protein